MANETENSAAANLHPLTNLILLH